MGLDEGARVSFTPITAGMDYQDKTIVNEIIKAWNERKSVIITNIWTGSWTLGWDYDEGGPVNYGNPFETIVTHGMSPTNEVTTGQDIQSVAFWKEIQDWLEDSCKLFVDYNLSLNGLVVANDNAAPEFCTPSVLFTLNTWRTAAFGNTLGFRRTREWIPNTSAPNWKTDITWSYGKIQAGDIIGPWILEDIQKGFDALRWTCRSQITRTCYNALRNHQKAIYKYDKNCNKARSQEIAAWNASIFTDMLLPNQYELFVYCVYTFTTSDTWDVFYGARRIGRCAALSIPTHLSCSCDVYLRSYGMIVGHSMDMDGFGIVFDGLYFLESLPESNASSRESSVTFGDGGNPVELAGFTCPLPSESQYQQQSATPLFVLKWDGPNGFQWRL